MEERKVQMTTTYTPGTRIDHYEIIRLLGQGGMNNVYLAEDIINRQKVVLKFPSVGAMLFEMLSGHAPFEGENVFAVMNQHVTKDPPSILQFNSNISRALATVVMRAIRRDPEKRYHSMKDLLHDLLHLDEVIPVLYIPETPSFGKRYQRAIVLTLVIIAICFTIIAFGILAQLAHHGIR